MDFRHRILGCAGQQSLRQEKESMKAQQLPLLIRPEEFSVCSKGEGFQIGGAQQSL